MTKVLLVDDDPKFRQLVTIALGAFKLNIVQATSVEEGTLELQAGKFDLIILDGCLHDMSGETWLRSVRDNGCNTDVVFVSGTWRDTESYYRLINELGVKLIVHKPISTQVFGEQIRQVIALPVSGEPTVDEAAALADDLVKLSAEYLEELPARLEELAACLRECTKGHLAKAGSFTEALKLAHRMRGTGTSFGQQWATNVATQVEERLKKSATSSQPMNAYVIGDLIDLVVESVAHCQTRKTPVRIEAAPSRVAAARRASAATRILLIDDDLFFTRKVEFLLCAEGMIVTTFTDTVRVFDVIDKVCPDLLILDINLPGVSGFDLCRFLRGHAHWADLPILMVTADTIWSARNMAMKAGASHCLIKPISNKDFVDEVHSLLSGDSRIVAEASMAVAHR